MHHFGPMFHIIYDLYLDYLDVVIHLILMCCITLIDFFHAKLSEHYWDKTIS